VRHDHLQRALAERGRMLPSDPSSGPLSLIGGNVATKASGAHAFKYGAIDRYIVALEAVLSDGSVSTPRSMPKWSRAVLPELREKLFGSTEALAAVRRHEGLKSASGYNLAALLEHEAGAQSPSLESQTLARLFTGSLGTLGLVSEVTLRTEPLERGRAGVLLFFRDLPTATEAASSVRTLDVAAIEILNREAIALARSAEPDIAVPEDSGALLLVETTGEARLTVSEEVRRRTAHLAKATHLAEGEEELTRLWSVRKRLLLLLRSYSPNHRALAVVNDVGVPPHALRRFTEHAEAVFHRHGLRAPMYGHAGDGNLHLRPLFDLRDPRLRHTLESVAREIYEAVVEHGGTITAEHGIGRQRAPFLEAEWGSEAYELMRRLKRSFDPEYLLNPEAMFPSHELGEHLDL
jgi:FAD/FMN-containing dehydrogenase